jgi:UDP-N-acetylmuramoyl-tripeptide--D-alanyl-D-alanine ligase
MPEFDAIDIASWTGGSWALGAPRTKISGVSIDSRALKPGQLFVAIRGERVDGHAYVAQALQSGAGAAMVQKDFASSYSGPGPLLVVDDPRTALSSLAVGYRSSLSAEMVAVTGSVGKTTVKEMTADVLSTLAPTARTRGNWNNDLGLPLSLLTLERDQRYGVFEVGMNHPGELKPLCDMIRPKWGLITTIGPVHIEFFQSVRAIADEKATVFRALPPDGAAVVSRDEEWFDLLRQAARCRLLTTSLCTQADYEGKILSESEGHFVVRERATGESVELRTSLPGRHVIQNALLAVAVGRGHGATWDQIASALKKFAPPPMRWSRSTVAGVTVINDAYNANPLSMRAALRTFAEVPVAGRRWVVLGGMRELGVAERDEHLALGRDAVKGSWAGFLVVGGLGRLMAEGARAEESSGTDVIVCSDCKEAAVRLTERLQPGDAVLLKASRGEHLEDVLKELEKNLGAVPEGKTCCTGG